MTADPRAVEIIAEATAQHHLDPDRTDADRHSFCVCGGWAEGEMEPGWDDHMADVAVAALEAAGWSLLPPGGQTRELRARILDIADQITAHPDDHGWTWSSLAEDLREAATPTEEAPSE